MPTPPPRKRTWSTTEDAQLTALHAAGTSLHAAAREMGWSKGSVSQHAAKLGLSWDRSRTAKAAEAVVVDNKARRARIVARMYGRMEHLQDRLEAATFRTVLKGDGGADRVRQLDFVPTPDERNIADTLSRYTAAATKLEAVDAGDGSDAVRSLLGGLARRLGLTDDDDPPAAALVH